ncbi:Calcium-binding protein like [Quillaja saponaria]|uniref:Calcium-binding protein like n=1 Tax=Quillaja saponaria TaxID=32244 RepID=A0AAD7LQQ8_QUISA|nr:Calcium-binding protein like [Quillaja saponaria]
MATEFEDLLPVMAEKLDVEAFVYELCGEKKQKLWLKEGDLDGDGKLNETEFCILMVRLSPGMMEDAEAWLEKALDQELSKNPQLH